MLRTPKFLNWILAFVMYLMYFDWCSSNTPNPDNSHQVK